MMILSLSAVGLIVPGVPKPAGTSPGAISLIVQVISSAIFAKSSIVPSPFRSSSVGVSSKVTVMEAFCSLILTAKAPKSMFGDTSKNRGLGAIPTSSRPSPENPPKSNRLMEADSFALSTTTVPSGGGASSRVKLRVT